MIPRVEIYTDGACSGNPGIGGWGAILRYKQTEKELSGMLDMLTGSEFDMQGLSELKKMLGGM